MRRPLFLVLALGAWLLPGGCGDAPAESDDPAVWAERAGAAFAAADESARQAEAAARGGTSEEALAHWDDAVAGWKDAARLYRNAFRLEEPATERRATRALLAFRTGRAMSNAARKRPAARASEGLAHEALLWFRQAEQIQGAMRQVHYERALLHESEVPAVRDLERARMAYEAYLAAVAQVADLPESERARAERARRRLQELAPSGGG